MITMICVRLIPFLTQNHAKLYPQPGQASSHNTLSLFTFPVYSNLNGSYVIQVNVDFKSTHLLPVANTSVLQVHWNR